MVECTSASSSSGLGNVPEGRFKCPNGQVLSLPEAVSSQGKDDLNFMFYGTPRPSPTESASTLAMAAGEQDFTPTKASMAT